MFLSKLWRGRLVDTKKKRMPFIAANGLLVLVPCAIFLNRWAAADNFDTTFYVVQAIELVAGPINLALMALKRAMACAWLAGFARRRQRHALPEKVLVFNGKRDDVYQHDRRGVDRELTINGVGSIQRAYVRHD